jgi:hypothetical protein
MPGSLHGCNGPRFVSRFPDVSGLWQAPPQTAKKMSAPAIVQSLGTAPRYRPRPGQTITKASLQLPTPSTFPAQRCQVSACRQLTGILRPASCIPNPDAA